MLVSSIIHIALALIYLVIPLTYIQADGYHLACLGRKKAHLMLHLAITAIVCLCCHFCSYAIIIADVCLVARIALYFGKTKARFVFTKRGIRLYLTSAIALLLIASVLFLLQPKARLIYLSTITVGSYLAVSLAIVITTPIENAINQRYIKKAKEKLAKIPIKIGITGSAGKTSVKNVLTAILSTQYTVYATPSNYNTPMGICRALDGYDNQEIFIAEMGARRLGDIRDLIDLVEPHVGVVTTVNQQHLETFGSIANIISEKTLLLSNLPAFGVVNASVDLLKDLDYPPNVIRVGQNSIFATDIVANLDGTSFTAVVDGERENFYTPLIGNRCVDNILLALSVATRLGIRLEDTVDVVARLAPTPHRLEKSVTARGITILDDGYNSNVEGVSMALEVLKTHTGRVVVCTQGIVEQGAKQHEINYKLGVEFAQLADIIIVVGVNRKAIAKGALSAGYSTSKLYMLPTLKKATELFATLLQSGDVLYIQNDVPIIY